METVLITGGAGFLGSSIAERLIGKYKIILYDNFFRDAISGNKNLYNKNLYIVNGSVLDAELLNDTMQNVDYVIHCAAIAGIDTVTKNPVDTMVVDGIGTLNVLEACKNNKKHKRVIVFSTSEVFGKDSFLSKNNGSASVGPVTESRWIYAISKLFSEHLSFSFKKQYGIDVVVVRPFNIYGPSQVGDSALMTFIKLALKNENLIVRNGGTQIRAWCYVSDFVDIIEKIIENNDVNSFSYNIGNNREAISIYQLAKLIKRVLNSKSEILFDNTVSPDVEIRIPDISDTVRDFNVSPSVSLEDGIIKVADAIRSKVL
jgi:UDP-glucose 4-epimerase